MKDSGQLLKLLTEGGGGPESMVMLAQIWTVLKEARESTAHIGFRTPPPVLPLMEGGGVRNWL
jgi:hypothetical protein